MKFIWFIPAISWFIISTILLTLPGNNLPQSGFFNVPYFDKVVHLIMFFLITGLFCYPVKVGTLTAEKTKLWLKRISFYTIAYGVVIELVQKYFVAGRSFDVVDIVFDTVGSLSSLLLMMKLPLKK